MIEYDQRFRNLSQEETGACLRELEAHVTVRGVRLLSAAEIGELLGLLPANYFKLLMRMRIQSIAGKRKDFTDKFADFDEAIRRFGDECRECLDADDDAARQGLIQDMDDLRLLHPALWLRVYKNLFVERPDLAAALEAADKALPFRKP